MGGSISNLQLFNSSLSLNPARTRGSRNSELIGALGSSDAVAGVAKALSVCLQGVLIAKSSQPLSSRWVRTKALAVGVMPPAPRLLKLAAIPEQYSDDPIFSQYICPITCEPIRHYMKDPNGGHGYEREAILEWLERSSTSPLTRQLLFARDLVEVPSIQQEIDGRLKELQGDLDLVWRIESMRRGKL